MLTDGCAALENVTLLPVVCRASGYLADFAKLICTCVGGRNPHNARLFYLFLGRSMRFTGTFLLLGGLFLCISVVWATVGFPMMGFGLICLLIDERRKKQSMAPPDPRSDAVDPRQEPPPLQTDKHAQPAELVEASPSKIELQRAPSSFPEPRQSRAPKPALILPKDQPAIRRNEPDTTLYDLEKWRALIKSDADISRTVETLQPFGKKYVDQLAMAYLAFEEKSYLPTIVKLVTHAIKKDTGRNSTRATAIDSDPNTDAMNKAHTSFVEQVFASPAPNDGFAGKSSVMSNAPPQTERDARVKVATVPSELKTSHSRPEGEAASSKRRPDAGRGDEVLAAKVTAPARKATASVADAQDLRDLLKRIA